VIKERDEEIGALEEDKKKLVNQIQLAQKVWLLDRFMTC